MGEEAREPRISPHPVSACFRSADTCEDLMYSLKNSFSLHTYVVKEVGSGYVSS